MRSGVMMAVVGGRRHKPGTAPAAALWRDDSEGDFQFETITGTGGDDVHAYGAAALRGGAAGLLLQTRATGAQANDWLAVEHVVSYSGGGAVYLEVYLRAPTGHGLLQWIWELKPEVGNRQYFARVRWDAADGKVYYRNSLGADVEVAALQTAWAADTWFRVRLGVNVTTLVYGTVSIDATGVDLSAQGLQDYAVGAADQTTVGVAIVAVAAAQATGHADDWTFDTV